MIDAYFKFETLSSEIREKNKIKSPKRFDCTQFTNDYPGIEYFKNKKGMFYLYLDDSDKIIKADNQRKAEYVLLSGGTNFTSLFNENDDFKFYGYPNGKLNLKNGSINPLHQFKKDAYLFQISKDFKTIELFIVKNHKGMINYLYQMFLDGEFDDEINSLRENGKSFFNYDY